MSHFLMPFPFPLSHPLFGSGDTVFFVLALPRCRLIERPSFLVLLLHIRSAFPYITFASQTITSTAQRSKLRQNNNHATFYS